MAKVVDACCVPSPVAVQLTKPDKNNNTTANVDDGIIIPSEQCDLVENGLDDKSESTGDSDDRRLSSGGDEEMAIADPTTTISSSLSNDDIEATTTPVPPPSLLTATNVDPYKDFTGVDTESFITTTLRNNPKDRTLLLTLETVLQQFIQDDEQSFHQFQPMNSYERMIVHRVAAFFGLDHNVDKNGQAVVVSKTPNTRIPNFSFQKCIPEDESTDTIPTISAATAAAAVSTSEIVATNSTTTPVPVETAQTRRILRRHDKNNNNNNHEHMQRNGSSINDDYTSHFHPSHAYHSLSSKTQQQQQPSSRPYSERANHYAETRARIFNESTNSNSPTVLVESPSTNKSLINSKTNNNNISNQKQQQQHASFVRPSSYRKQHQNSSHQHRSYTYHQYHAQSNSNNPMQQYSTVKTLDPSSHMLTASTTRTPSIYTAQQASSASLSMPQPPMYASMTLPNAGAAQLRPSVTTFYAQQPQQSMDYDYKQQTGPPTYNYVSMMPPTATFIHPHQQQQVQSQQQQLHPSTTGPNQAPPPPPHATGIPIPILVHQQPGGQIQYLFPASALPQQQQQQQQQQLPPPQQTPPGSYQLPDGHFVQIYRPDSLPLTGPPSMSSASIVDSNNTHHPYSQTQPYHHHPLSQQQPQQQQQSQPPSQSNPPPPPPPFVRIFPTATPGNISHPFAQGTYQAQPPPQTTFVQPGTIPTPSYMLPPPHPQANGGVQSFAPFDGSMSFATAYNPAATTKTSNVNNNGAPVQFATTYLAALTLQQHPQHDDYQTRLHNNQQQQQQQQQARFPHSNGVQQRNFMGRPLVQSPNGSRMTVYPQQYRQSRPSNVPSDKQQQQQQTTPIENDASTNSKQQTTNSDNMPLAGPAQE